LTILSKINKCVVFFFFILAKHLMSDITWQIKNLVGITRNAVTHCNHLREDLPKKHPVNVWEGDILLFSCTSKSDYGTNTLVCQTLFMKLFSYISLDTIVCKAI
jgi:hypothetical protein